MRYTDNGSHFLCRTYFDKGIFDALEQEDEERQADSRKQAERRTVFEENEGYLFSDFWPFIIIHFGEKKKVKPPLDILKTSLTMLIDSFQAEECRGYYQGRDAYKAWIRGLSEESDFRIEDERDNVLRRLDVNDNMLCNLADARRAAAAWLREDTSLANETGRQYLDKIAENCKTISDTVSTFRDRVRRTSACEIAYNTINAYGVFTPGLRKEQIDLLENALTLEEENCRLAEMILELPEMMM